MIDELEEEQEEEEDYDDEDAMDSFLHFICNTRFLMLSLTHFNAYTKLKGHISYGSFHSL